MDHTARIQVTSGHLHRGNAVGLENRDIIEMVSGVDNPTDLEKQVLPIWCPDFCKCR